MASPSQVENFLSFSPAAYENYFRNIFLAVLFSLFVLSFLYFQSQTGCVFCENNQK